MKVHLGTGQAIDYVTERGARCFGQMIIVFQGEGLVFAGKTVFGFLVCSNYPTSSSALTSVTMTQKLGAVLNCVHELEEKMWM